MESTGLDIRPYIKKTLENENFKINDIVLTGSTDKADGYSSDVLFATVLGHTEGTNKIFDVAIKCHKKNSVENRDILYKREVYVYSTILPEFTRFEIQNNIKNVFDTVPKYYNFMADENVDIIIFENLKKNGYRLFDRKKPLDLHHLKLVLREYGKLHAISFALREKNKPLFEKLVTDYDDVLLSGIISFFYKMFQQRIETVCDLMKKANETELYGMCHELSEKGAGDAMVTLLKTVEPESAILHGDCWINNFLFKYECEDQNHPSKVAILDWQLSRLHSPVLDLSCFIYSTCSEEQLKHFDELLDAYYTSFSTFLKDLGCDPEILFPYSALQRHWNKYSLYGFLTSTTFLHVILCEKEEAPSDYKDGHDFADKVINMQTKNDEEYQKRLVAIVSHYYKYTCS